MNNKTLIPQKKRNYQTQHCCAGFLHGAPINCTRRRGCLDGFDLQDWLQAEREILGQVEPPEQAAAVGR